MSGTGAGLYLRPPGESERLVVVAPDPAGVLGALAGVLAEPLALVYVLLRSGTFRPEGRYQTSRPLARAAVEALLARFGPFLSGDGRHGLAVLSMVEAAAVTLDRRGVVEVHGPVERAVPVLRTCGLVEGTPAEPAPRPVAPAHDADEQALLAATDWTWFPLEPGDALLD
ncbi:hypothetical protein [Anaeromyxobacter oryzae]|uniref:Uncharacterized protein n=1 Tax=Anaeromyxobacter oryzae TaxID=2918170 RepID=A0ABN6MWP5_9BACT|nr:hypothetical protein [Anaeromyxobacter oryzae]BDG03943.1 hypothetical protein AMOR_29390 [Anaeromyxobacter oryzae]